MGLYTEPVLPHGITAANLTAVAEYYTIHAVPQRYNPGIIIASVAVSVLGAYSTLLLLGKRTSNKGFRNVALLVLAAGTMAAVGIWGMHFIGMHMTLRPVEGVSWFIMASAGFTVFSLFVPLVALTLAFLVVDQTVAFSAWRVGFSGVITGAVVALMHYSASFGANFKVSYAPAQTTASILLACLASTVALMAFFRFKSQWSDSWWKRLLCACILACGVSGMHYTALSGTSYRVKPEQVNDPMSMAMGSRKNNTLTIAIAVMCFVIVVISVVIAVLDGLSHREARRKAKKVVVASATFDKQGRLLVKADGTLPMVVIDTDVQTRDVLDALDNRQPTFQWLYALSWDWDIVAPFLKAITTRFFNEAAKSSADAAEEKKKMGMRANAKRALQARRSIDTVPDSSRGPKALADFRDRFVDAAGQLAVELDIPLQQIGVLFDHVQATGTRKTLQPSKNELSDPDYQKRPRADDESSINGPVASIFGDCEEDDEGVMLFLVRELPNPSNATTGTADSAERYRQRGYRMTETRSLAGVLADRVSVHKEDMETLLGSLKLFAKRGTRPVVQPGGVYAGLFGVRASTSKQGGLDVLAYNFARHQIPAYRLPDVKFLNQSMKKFLRELDQMTMEDAMRTCERESIRSGERKTYLASRSDLDLTENQEIVSEQEEIELMIQFQTSLFIALDALHNSVRFYPKITQTGRISAEVLEVPSSLDDSTPPAEMILVQAVLPESSATGYSAYNSGNNGTEAFPTEKPSSATPFVFTPYTLFSKSQMMLLRGRQADDFEHEVVLELRRRYPSSVMAELDEKNMASPGTRKDSLQSGELSSFPSDESGFSNHKYPEDGDHDRSLDSTKATVIPEVVRQWAGKFTSRRTSREGADTTASRPGMRTTGEGGRRHSNISISSRLAMTMESEHEMRDVSGHIPVLKSNAPRPVSPISPVSPTSIVSGALSNEPTSPAVMNPSALAPPAEVNGTASLGIRRFTNGGLSPAPTSHLSVAPQARFAQAVDENPSPAPGLGNDLVGTFGEPRTPPQVHRNRQGIANNTHSSRPSTAPVGGRREAALQRPKTADSHSPMSPVLSQRHASSSTRQNEASLVARLRSDDWSTRQLQSLERGPSGADLLGVDF